MKKRRWGIWVQTFIVSGFSRNMTESRLEMLGLSGFRRNVARHVGVRQCARTSGQCEVFDRNWRLPSSGRAASQLPSYFTLECTSSKSSSEESSFDTDVPAYPPLFSFQHLRFPLRPDIRRVFRSPCQRGYCKRIVLSRYRSRVRSPFCFNYSVNLLKIFYYECVHNSIIIFNIHREF